MELKTYFAQDAAGNLVPGATVTIFLQGTTTHATGLTKADGTALSNPFTADSAGRIQFRAPDGYYDMRVNVGSGGSQTVTIQCVDYTGAKADADRAEAAADRADFSAEQAQNSLNSIIGINANFEQNSREQWRRSLADAGLTLVSGSFEEGAEANSSTDAVWHIAGGQCYTWGGALPKTVPADSTPESSGGVGLGAWVSVGDASLRQELAAPGGASLVGPGVMTRGNDKFSILVGNTGENRTPGIRSDLMGPRTGTSTGNGNFLNMVFVENDQQTTTGKVAGLMVDHRFGSGTGGRHGFMSRLIQTSPQLNSTTDQNYVAAVAQVLCDFGDPAELAIGSVLFASESYAESRADTGKVRAVIGSIHEASVTGTVQPEDRIGVQVTSKGSGFGTRADAAMGVSSTGVPWKDGILFSNLSGSDVFDATSNVLRVSPLLSSNNKITLGSVIKIDPDVTFSKIIATPRLSLTEAALDMNLSSASVKLGAISASNTPHVDFRSGTTAAPGYDSRIIATGGNGNDASGNLQAQCGAFISTGAVRPSTDGTIPTGTASNRWSVVYASTGTINTSDARCKPVQQKIPDAVLDAWSDVDWGTRFKFDDAISIKGEDGARWHFGLIAQHVEKVFAEHGIDGFSLGLLCYDEWDSEEEIFDESGKVLTPAIEAGSRYGIRYEEALALEAALQRRNHSRLLDKYETLAARIDALEAK